MMDATKPKRKNIRLPGYDYSLSGGYFVTIATDQRGNVFGVAEEGNVNLNPIGKMIRECWLEIPNHFVDVILDEFIVMPDHLHGILFINETDVGARHASPKTTKSNQATHASPLQKENFENKPQLGVIIGSFKSAASKKVNQLQNSPGQKLWQRGYYDRIIRGQKELKQIRNYVIHSAIKQDLPAF